MHSQYKYRAHLKYFKIIFPSIVVILIAILWLLWLFLDITDELVIPLVVFTVILAIEAVVIWRLMRRFTLIRVAIDKEAITYTNYKGDIRIEYGDIKELKFSSIRYTGGWIKIISHKGVIRLTVVIENIQGLLSELKEELDKRGLSDKYNRNKFFKYLKTATFCDLSWQRVYQIWIKLIIATIVTTVIGLGAAWYFDEAEFHTFLFTLFSYVFPTVIYIITEIIFGRRVAKLSNFDSFTVPGRDEKYENAIYKKAILIGTITYIAIISLCIAT